MPSRTCAVAGCKGVALPGSKGVSSQFKISFHRFPRNEELRQIWVLNTLRADQVNPDKSRICSLHFTPEDFQRDLQAELMGTKRRPILKPNAVPTLGLGNCPISPSSSSGSEHEDQNGNKMLNTSTPADVEMTEEAPCDTIEVHEEDVNLYTFCLNQIMGNNGKLKLGGSEWKNSVRKALRNSGQPYISSKKKAMPGKHPAQAGKICRCPFDCGQIQHEEKIKLFTEFYGLSYDGQSRFLATKCLKIVGINRRRVTSKASRRTCTIQYYLPREDGDLRVCKSTICDIFKITCRRLSILVDKMRMGKSLIDRRGSRQFRPSREFDDREVIVVNPDEEDDVALVPDENQPKVPNRLQPEIKKPTRREEALMTSLHLSNWLHERSQVFGNYVASELRSINNDQIRRELELDIQKSILKYLEKDS